MRHLLTFMAAAAALPAAAGAEVVSSGPHGFHVRHSVQMVVPPDRAFDTFANIASWWKPAHTYGGKAENLRLSLSPGGCFCEQLEGGGWVEHLRLSYIEPGERLVLSGSLGPLLYEATSGAMDVRFERIAGGSRVTLDYKVAGFAAGGAERLAPAVDRVLGEQMQSYRQVARAAPLIR